MAELPAGIMEDTQPYLTPLGRGDMEWIRREAPLDAEEPIIYDSKPQPSAYQIATAHLQDPSLEINRYWSVDTPDATFHLERLAAQELHRIPIRTMPYGENKPPIPVDESSIDVTPFRRKVYPTANAGGSYAMVTPTSDGMSVPAPFVDPLMTKMARPLLQPSSASISSTSGAPLFQGSVSRVTPVYRSTDVSGFSPSVDATFVNSSHKKASISAPSLTRPVGPSATVGNVVEGTHWNRQYAGPSPSPTVAQTQAAGAFVQGQGSQWVQRRGHYAPEARVFAPAAFASNSTNQIGGGVGRTAPVPLGGGSGSEVAQVNVYPDLNTTAVTGSVQIQPPPQGTTGQLDAGKQWMYSPPTTDGMTAYPAKTTAIAAQSLSPLSSAVPPVIPTITTASPIVGRVEWKGGAFVPVSKPVTVVPSVGNSVGFNPDPTKTIYHQASPSMDGSRAVIIPSDQQGIGNPTQIGAITAAAMTDRRAPIIPGEQQGIRGAAQMGSITATTMTDRRAPIIPGEQQGMRIATQMGSITAAAMTDKRAPIIPGEQQGVRGVTRMGAVSGPTTLTPAVPVFHIQQGGGAGVRQEAIMTAAQTFQTPNSAYHNTGATSHGWTPTYTPNMHRNTWHPPPSVTAPQNYANLARPASPEADLLRAQGYIPLPRMDHGAQQSLSPSAVGSSVISRDDISAYDDAMT